MKCVIDSVISFVSTGNEDLAETSKIYKELILTIVVFHKTV